MNLISSRSSSPSRTVRPGPGGLALALLVALAACGGTDDADPAGPAAADPTTPGVCNTLANVATTVPILAVASDPPPARGGSFSDGTYVATGATLYTGAGGATGPTGRTLTMTVRVAGTRLESIFDAVPRTAVITGIQGTSVQTTGVCPNTKADSVSFTADGATLALYLIDSSGTRVYSFDKRGP